MKPRIVLTTVFAGLLPLAAFAQTPAPPAAPAQPAIAQVQSVPPVSPVPPMPPMPPVHSHYDYDDHSRGPVTFLGVETSRVPRVVSEQLGLPRGFGVVVDVVVSNSAAAAAGVQQNDIIRMLNDQIVIDSEQLGVLVRSFANGATINLTVVRKGQEVKLTAKLLQKQARNGHDGAGYEWNFDGMDDFHLPDMSAVREAVERAKKETLRAGDEAREAMRKFRVVTADDETVRASHIDLGKAQIVFSDDKGELRLQSEEGKRVLTAKDASGKVLFHGPVDTKEERAKIPAEVRQRYDNLEHQDLPPLPPNEQLAPRPPGPNESAHLRGVSLEQATLVPNHRTGWVRSTVFL